MYFNVFLYFFLRVSPELDHSNSIPRNLNLREGCVYILYPPTPLSHTLPNTKNNEPTPQKHILLEEGKIVDQGIKNCKFRNTTIVNFYRAELTLSSLNKSI